MLPTPPADVVATLLKARTLALNVAAVPEAVRFVQSPTELYTSATVNPQDEWARRQGYADYADWVKRDPIVFHDHGTASAIIAQFGDFPIEKEVVDMVVAGNDLIPQSPTQATTLGMLSGGYASGLITGNGSNSANTAGMMYQEMLRQQQMLMVGGNRFRSI